MNITPHSLTEKVGLGGRKYWVEEGADLKPSKLDDEAYKEAQASFPIIGIDILLYNREQNAAYLALRTLRPMSGAWWFIGGRVRFGQTEEEAAKSIFKRETRQDLDVTRVKFFDTYRTFWKDRDASPTDVGSDTTALVFGIEVTMEEVEAIGKGLDPQEYSEGKGLRAFPLEEILEPGKFEIFVQRAAQHFLG